MSRPLDYSKWAKIADDESTEDEGDNLGPKMDPTFAKRYVADKLQKDGICAMRSRKPNVIRHNDIKKTQQQTSMETKDSTKINNSGFLKRTTEIEPKRRKQWHEIRGRDTRWDNIEVSSSSEEVEDVGDFGMIDPAKACQMLLDKGRRELPKEMRWGEEDPKHSERAKQVMDHYKSLRTRLENIDISLPLSSSDQKHVNLPFMPSYLGGEKDSEQERCITPLCYAVQRQSPELVKFLLKNGASQKTAENVGGGEENDGWYALHWASRMGNSEILKILLENGGKEMIDTLSSLGIAAVSIAMQNSSTQCLKLLIDAKADMNNGIVTPLTVFMVKMQGVEKAGGKAEIDLETFQMLLSAGSEVDIVLDKMPLGFKSETTLRIQLLKASEGFANRESFLRILEEEKPSAPRE